MCKKNMDYQLIKQEDGVIKLASLTDRGVLEGGGCPGQPSEPLPPKRQAVVERLRRRIEGYRRHQNSCIPRFDHSFNGVVEQNLQDTLLLKQRFLENKPKRPVKKSEKKPAESSIQNNISLPKFPKCSAPEDTSDSFPDSSKQQQKHENMTKFSVEIVQQLEFTATSTNSQISTNVTVKALNTSVKGDVPNSPQSPRNINIVECKQEPENIDFVDLEQCAAALEKDANGGNSFPGLSDLIGDDTADAISSDTFKDLISEISEYSPELMMKEFDFNSGDKNKEEPKLESLMKTQPISCTNVQQAVMNQQRLCGNSIEMSKQELSPAAQTLKNMAEQHQHKAQMGIGFTRINQKPYEFQYSGTTEFVGQTVNQNNFKVSSPYSNDGIKQESFSAQNSPVGYANSPGTPLKTPSPQRMATQYKQQVYQYGGQMSPQYRPQQPIKIDYSKTQVSHQPMITFPQAGMLQPIPPSGPMLRAPQPQYLPRYTLPMPRASYTKAPRIPQQEPTWMIQRPQQEFLQEAHINQLQMSRVQQQIQMNQVRVHQSVSALSRTTSVPFSTSYTNANASYAQSNFNMQQTFSQQSAIAPEFCLDFLEQLPHSDVVNFSDQELLFSSLESGTNFNFPDIL